MLIIYSYVVLDLRLLKKKTAYHQSLLIVLTLCTMSYDSYVSVKLEKSLKNRKEAEVENSPELVFRNL